MLKIVAVIVAVVVDSHVQRVVLATEETTVTQRDIHRPIKCLYRPWSQGGTKVNGPHHGENPLLKPTEIQSTIKSLPGPTTRDHRKHVGIKMMSLA